MKARPDFHGKYHTVPAVPDYAHGAFLDPTTRTLQYRFYDERQRWAWAHPVPYLSGLGSPLPHLSGLGLPLPHLHRDLLTLPAHLHRD